MKNNIQLIKLLLPYQQKFFLNNKKRKIWISSRQVGKSFTLAFLLVYKALQKKNGLSLCISVNMASASEIIRKVEQVAEAIKILTNGRINYSKSFDKVVFNNGSRVLSLSSNPAGMRGYTAQLVCLDEAAFIEHLDQVMAAIGPTLSRDPNAELVLTSTPAGKNGYFYKLFQEALNNEDIWNIQTTTIDDAINDGLKNIDIEQLKTLCPDPIIFRQEYYCEFCDEVNSLIDINLLEVYQNLNINNVDYFIGVDFGRTNDMTAISIVARDRDTDIKYLIDLVCLKNMEFAKQLERIKIIFNRYEPKILYADAGGLGKPLAEELNLKFNSRCKPFIFSNNTKNECYELFRKLVFSKQFFINKKFINNIIEDVSLIRQTVTENGRTIYTAERKNDSHADAFSSLVLALKGSDDCFPKNEMPLTIFRQSRF